MLLCLYLDQNGVLHREPLRLLKEDTRGYVQAHSLLSSIGAGNQRLSNIAKYLQKPTSSLGRPLTQLLELEYICKETPWGESEKTSRHTLYQLGEPFLKFWYRFIEPNQSLLQQNEIELVETILRKQWSQHVSTIWEDLARASVSHHQIGGIRWKPAKRWWGGGLHKQPIELDIVAESIDEKSLLLGEVKWGDTTHWGNVSQKLENIVEWLPFAKKYSTIYFAYWGKHPSPNHMPEHYFSASELFPAT